MADPFLGEIRAVAFNYAPAGWMLCNGQLLPVSQYQALFGLIGNHYGGDGVQNFSLPNLLGRTITHAGLAPAPLASLQWGQAAGVSSVTLTAAQMPNHNHAAAVTDPGHMHSVAVPAHTHPFGVPCDNSAGPQTNDPTGAFHAVSSGVTDNINVLDSSLITELNNAGVAINATPVGPTMLYAKSSNAVMGQGTTGPNVGSVGSSGTSLTGITVTTGGAGASSPFAMQPPTLGLYYIICVTNGIWPPRC